MSVHYPRHSERRCTNLQDVDYLSMPSASDLECFHERGWFACPVIFSDEEIASARAGAAAFYDGIVDFPLVSRDGIADDSADESLSIRNNEFVTLQKRELQALGWHPAVTHIARALTGSSTLRLFSDSLIVKFPENREGTGAVGWHTDKAYWPTCSSDKLVTVWIPLQDCTLDMGPLVYLDGSHKWRERDDLKAFYGFNNQELSSLEEYLATRDVAYERSFMTLKKGQACFHSCHTVHGSFPNTSERPRMALTVHFQDGANRYQEAFKPDGEKIVIGYDRLCAKDADGFPNYADEKLFPLL